MKRNFKKGISMLVALAMTLTSASVVFADGELVTAVKYRDGFVTVTGTTENANEAVDVFLLNPGETKVDLGGADTTAEYNETVNFSDVIYSDAAKDFEITFEISEQNDEAAYLLYVKAENGEEYSKTISLNNIYVAANGSDTTGNGSKAKPYATIQRAQTAARAASKDVATNVIIGEGTYAITSALTFTADDSGTAEAPVTYKAAEGAKVVVSGATQIPMDKISPLTEADSAIINRLPASVAKKVVKVDLSDISDDITGYASKWSATKRLKPMGVYLNDDYQDISRWPNTGYTNIKSADKKGPNNSDETASSTDYASITISGLDYNKTSSWQEKENVFIDGYIGVQWYVESAKMGTITQSGTDAKIRIEHPTTYGVVQGGRVVLKNILEEIDSPGEWYVDGKTMYYYPPHTLTSDDTLEITTLQSTMVTVAGATNIAIEGITFEKNSNVKGSAAVAISSGDNITIKDCAMKDIGGWGITHSNAKNVTIDGCVMNNLGMGGISTSSGDTTNLTSYNTVIKNCHISDVAREYQANSVAAVTISGCGTTVKNNTFHNMKNSAIRYSGTKHLFKENEIFNAVNDTTDAGAIYSGRSYVNYGTKILNNYLYHIGGRSELQSGNPVAGIYWDDNQSGETAIGNIIVTNSTASGTMGIHIGGGADVVVTDNILANVSDAEPTNDSNEAKRVGPYAVHANRDNKTTIENGTYLSSEVFASYLGATNLTFNSNEKDENGNLKYDTDGDGILTSTELNAARGALLVANSGKENWKSAYLTEFDGKVRSMFELLIGKKFQKRNTYKDNFSYRAIDNVRGYMNPYHKTDGILGTGWLAKEDGDKSITYAESVEVAKSGFAQTNDYD
ncbi:MAG: right-handed parallel beta-helix repeat-containing protein, partial [Clostridia bacterium]|nr:right-handed parallel beta-helix repeat-containing protein [Clostridia bacterium]